MSIIRGLPAAPPPSSTLPSSLLNKLFFVGGNQHLSLRLVMRNLSWCAGLCDPVLPPEYKPPQTGARHDIPSTAWNKVVIDNLIVNDQSTKWLDVRLQEGTEFCLCCSLLNPQCQEKGLAHGWHSINICWISEWISGTSASEPGPARKSGNLTINKPDK